MIVGLVALTLTQYHEQHQLQLQREGGKDHGEGAAAASVALLNAGGPGINDSADYVELARGSAEPSAASRAQLVPSRPR